MRFCVVTALFASLAWVGCPWMQQTTQPEEPSIQADQEESESQVDTEESTLHVGQEESVVQQVQIDTAQVGVNDLASLVRLYHLMYQRLPSSLDDLTVDSGRGQLLQSLPVDPWGNSYNYVSSSPNTYTVGSSGPNEGGFDHDDIYPNE